MHPQIENKIKPAQQKHLRTVVIQFEIFHPGRRDPFIREPFIRQIFIPLADISANVAAIAARGPSTKS